MANLLESSLTWSAVLRVATKSTRAIPGDKILLPQSALEQLLAASRPASSTPAASHFFDPYNPTFRAAARIQDSQFEDNRQLPHPLTFRLVNPKNGNVVHAGIREFSAVEGEIGLSPFLSEALGVSEPKSSSKPPSVLSDAPGTSADPLNLSSDQEPIDLTKDVEEEAERITVHAKQLPKGTYVRLRPLEAGYDPDDWKALLERHLRDNFTTLTNGEILLVNGAKSEQFRFLIDKLAPEGDGICVVDTDLEVDIEALNEEQARETLKHIMAKAHGAPSTAENSSTGGDLDIWKASAGQVVSGDYVDYRLPSWDRSQAISIEVIAENGEDLDLFVSPYSSRQRVRPRDDEHLFGDFGCAAAKNIILQPSNIEFENAEALYISIHASETFDSAASKIYPFSLRARSVPISLGAGSSENPFSIDDTEMHSSDEEQCKNCQQWVPKSTMTLHENFCFRNNILCPECKNVFQKKSEEWQNHWHCPYDLSCGDTAASKKKHDGIYHTPRQCPNCGYTSSNLKDLAAHRTSICPGKLILCQFCHLEVPQEGDPFDPSPEVLISGLTAHELADGARTTECHLCSRIVRLRDMGTHLKHHDLERESRSKPSVCRNVNCGRTLDGVGKNGEIGAGKRMGQGPGNDLGLCSMCYGPLYANVYDPEGKAIKRRVERNYLRQMIAGCGKNWCQNEFCKTAKAHGGDKRANITSQEALVIIKPITEMVGDRSKPMYLCTDESSQRRRRMADMLSGEKVYDSEWCIASLEAESGNLDKARMWLHNWAPQRS